MIHKSRVSGLHEDAQKLYNELVQWYNSCKEEDEKAKELGYTGGFSPKDEQIKKKAAEMVWGHCSPVKEVLWGMGWSLGDIGYHGWYGEAARNEHLSFHELEKAYWNLMSVLEQYLGMDENSVGQTSLKKIIEREEEEKNRANGSKD